MNWQCNKCRTQNRPTNDQCAWCSAPKPPPEQDGRVLGAKQETDRLVTSLHNAIEKMDHNRRIRVWRWMEDNIL